MTAEAAGGGTKLSLLRVAAGVHLAIAALFSTHILVEHFLPQPFERILRVYGNYTGASTHFNFFAPQVVTQTRVLFTGTARDGSKRPLELKTSSSEVNVRIAAMTNALLIPDSAQALVRSWSRYLLERHPDIVAIEVRVEILDIPPIAQLRTGRASAWVELLRVQMRREAPLGR